MAGILDWLGLSSANQPSSTSGIFAQQPAAQAASAPSSPPKWATGLGIFGATAKDIGANLQGDPNANNLQIFQRQQKDANAERLGQIAQQALVDAGSDPIKLKSAILNFAAAGGDPSTLIAAAKFGSPVISTASPTENVYSTDPFTGERTLVQQGQIKPNFNQPFNADGTANAAYQAYQTKLARDRAQATADFRAPKSGPKVAPTFSIPHPGSQF